MTTTTPSPPSLTRYSSADEIKRQLGYSQTSSVLRLVKEQGLPAHRVNRRYLFDPAEVEAWLRTRNATAAPGPTAPQSDWVVEQVAKFSPEDLRRAAGILLTLASAMPEEPTSLQTD